jgi:hypothetical protein
VTISDQILNIIVLNSTGAIDTSAALSAILTIIKPLEESAEAMSSLLAYTEPQTSIWEREYREVRKQYQAIRTLL